MESKQITGGHYYFLDYEGFCYYSVLNYIMEEILVNGSCYLHRIDGPAKTIKYGNQPSYEWWIKGRRLPKYKEKLLNIWYINKLKVDNV